MNKALALSFIGGSPLLAAKAVGVSRSAVAQWPDPLPPKLVDRVVAAWARQNVNGLPAEFLRQQSAAQEVPHG
jgi:hypothetical protein